VMPFKLASRKRLRLDVSADYKLPLTWDSAVLLCAGNCYIANVVLRVLRLPLFECIVPLPLEDLPKLGIGKI
jgi:hypothetical protein